MKKCSFNNRFEPINSHALEQLRSQGDVFGWVPLENDKEPSALLLISTESPLDSFPASIAGVKLVLKRILNLEVQEPCI